MARTYLRRGWKVIPIPARTKAPILAGWQNLKLTEADLTVYFSSASNIGILLGEPSGWLVDVDLDSPETVGLADQFLPTTCSVFGRPGKLRSHWEYVSRGAKTEKFQDVKREADKPAMLVEVRSTGAQTVFPGSVHPSGETISWDQDGEPAQVDYEVLRQGVARLAAAALLARHWPAEGSRNNAALALAGGLLRGGWSGNETAQFVEAVAEAAGDEEAEARALAARGTAKKLSAEPDSELTGWPTLADMIGNEVVRRVRGWLRMIGQEFANQPKRHAGQPKQRLPVLVRLADVEPEAVSWLWEPYVARRKLTLLEGDPGLGKTWMALFLAAIISKGGPWPGPGSAAETRHPENIIYMTAEDGLADTLRPRLDQAGADVTRVHALTGTLDDDGVLQPLTLADNGVLRRALEQVTPALLVVDPIQGYMGAGVDMHRANEVRPVLARLAALAEEFNCAALCIRHLGKSAQDRAVYRGLGSIDFAAAARSILLAGADPKDPTGTRRALAQVKNSLGPIAPTLGYAITPEGFCWTGLSDLTAKDLLAPDPGPPKTSRAEEAEAFLRDVLKDGPRPQKEIRAEAEDNGIKWHTLKRAKEQLEIESLKDGKSGIWSWKLPQGDQASDEDQNSLNTQNGLLAPLASNPTATSDSEHTSKKPMGSLLPKPETQQSQGNQGRKQGAQKVCVEQNLKKATMDPLESPTPDNQVSKLLDSQLSKIEEEENDIAVMLS